MRSREMTVDTEEVGKCHILLWLVCHGKEFGFNFKCKGIVYTGEWHDLVYVLQ